MQYNHTRGQPAVCEPRSVSVQRSRITKSAQAQQIRFFQSIKDLIKTKDSTVPCMHIHNIHLKLEMSHGNELVMWRTTLPFNTTWCLLPLGSRKRLKELPKAASNQGLSGFLLFFPRTSFMKLTVGQVRTQYSNHYLFWTPLKFKKLMKEITGIVSESCWKTAVALG